MKLVGHDGSTAIILFTPEEIRPQSGVHSVGLNQALAERYSFAKVPTIEEMFGQSGRSTFLGGKLVGPDGNIAFNELTMGSVGITIGAESTGDVELILRDLREWLTSRFKFRNLDSLQPSAYASNIVVEFDHAIERHIPKLAKIIRLFDMASATEALDTAPIELKRLAFSRDPERAPKNALLSDFIVERRVGALFEKNRYFCRGPVTTNKLVSLMEEFEAIISAE